MNAIQPLFSLNRYKLEVDFLKYNHILSFYLAPNTITKPNHQMSECHIQIDRSNTRSVNKHIRSVFIDLKKKKTKILLSSYYQWYCRNPQYHSEEITDFDTYVRKNKDNFEGKNKSVERVYGDKYATMLTKFVRTHRLFANELMQIARDSVELSKFEGRGNLGFTKLFNEEEIQKLEEIFKLLQVETGKTLVLQTNVEKRQEQKPNKVTKKLDADKVLKLLETFEEEKESLDIEDPVRKPVGKVKTKSECDNITNDGDYDEPVRSPIRRVKLESEPENFIIDGENCNEATKVSLESQQSEIDNKPTRFITTLAKLTTKAVGSIIENNIKIAYSPEKFSIDDVTNNFAQIELTHTSTIKQSRDT